MTDSTADQLEINFFDDFPGLENSLDEYFGNHNSTSVDFNFLDDPIEDLEILSEESGSSVNPVDSSSNDIPTDPKEWRVKDQASKRDRPPRLYEFLILLLQKPHYASYASYKDKSQGIFEVHQPEKVADLWQQIKNRQSTQKMTYDKFARAIRWYYKGEIMKKTNARYTFQFSSKIVKTFIIDGNNNTIMNYSDVM
jgi:hypothetical protein